jgi:protein FAM32A
MPASDYTSTVSGGLKLKGGAKDGGIKKKKKSSSSSSSSSKKKSATEPTKEEVEAGSEESKPTAESSTALARQAQIDEDDEEQALERSRSRSSSAVPTNNSIGTGKTEAQRRHEEIKRKRVSEMLQLQPAGVSTDIFSPLTARRATPARRRRQNAQAARRRAEQVPVDAVGAPRHAAHWTRITRPTILDHAVLVPHARTSQLLCFPWPWSIPRDAKDALRGYGAASCHDITGSFSEGVITNCRRVLILSFLHLLLIRYRYFERWCLCIAWHALGRYLYCFLLHSVILTSATTMTALGKLCISLLSSHSCELPKSRLPARATQHYHYL